MTDEVLTCGYLFGARCRLFAYGPADATVIPQPYYLLPHENPEWFLPARRYARAGTSYGPVSVCLSVTSRCSISMDGRIELVSGT